MQAKPQKIIKLANRSRKNRVFFDQLIRMLAVELHLGSDELNRFHLMPVYVCHSHARETAHSEHYIQLNRDSGCLYQPLCEVLPAALIDQLEALLTDAPANLKGRHLSPSILVHLKLSPYLFWDFDTTQFDFDKNAAWLIQRVLEYGQMSDWNIIEKHFGVDKIVSYALNFRTLNPVARSFLSFHLSPSILVHLKLSLPKNPFFNRLKRDSN